MTDSRIVLNASTLGLVDLDFPLQAKSLAAKVAAQATAAVECIELDLRGCIVLYSCSNEFFDVALTALLNSSGENRTLEVITTLDYLDEAITSYELFRGCVAVKNTTTSASIVQDLNHFCSANKLTVRVVVKPFSDDAISADQKIYEYK
jgi:hypothetical protein